MPYWFNSETHDVAEGETSPWGWQETMGPYHTADDARAAFAIADVRNVVADSQDRAWEAAWEGDKDDWDKQSDDWGSAD